MCKALVKQTFINTHSLSKVMKKEDIKSVVSKMLTQLIDEHQEECSHKNHDCNISLILIVHTLRTSGFKIDLDYI